MIKKILPVLALCLCIFACENEPLEGEFVTDDTTVDGGGMGDGGGDSTDPDPTAGTFSAKVDGVDFFASGTNVVAGISIGTYAIAARDNVTGDEILITVETPTLGELPFNFETGSTVGAAYDPTFDDDDPESSAYVALGEADTPGVITLTELNLDSGQTSGTFSFTAKREVFNDDGEIVEEFVEITEGEFSDVFYTGDLGGTDDNVFKADLDGTELGATTILVSTVEFAGETVLTISGINDTTNQVLGLQFNLALTPGTYEFESLPSPGATIMTYNPDAADPSVVFGSQSGGSLTITEITADGRYIGTFELTLQNFIDPAAPTIEVTNGEFNVSPL
ncbi:DUF6252 family protein [Gilvibacter sp.]|jgi:hypothetical protein|uniref:DUF6252 family protein n=1 Tax=Gilvibacter sp. TaxID=2729997 RepID=UPI003B51CBD7